jgi:hypothetical protein
VEFVEHGDAIVIADHAFTVEMVGFGFQLESSLHDAREALGPICSPRVKMRT